MVRYSLILGLTLSACFALQSLALRAVGGRTAKSESNFFSSIGRIQAAARGRSDVMFLGSSITGRLPDRAQGFEGTANMGCDGGSAIDALRAMDEGILPSAPLLVIEANTLQLALSEKPTEIGMAMKRPWFKVGIEVPAISAYARPAAFFYSKLLAGKIGGYAGTSGHDDLDVQSRPAPVTSHPSRPLSKRELALIDQVSGMLERLRRKGTEAVVVWLPPARKDGGDAPEWILELARRSSIPYWDLGQQAARDSVILTDGVHMDAPSAARTMRTLLAALSR